MIAALLAAVLLVPAGLGAGPFEVSLIEARIGKPLGAGFPPSVVPIGHEAGVKLSFLVRGEHLIAFKDDSVEIKSFILGDGRPWICTPDGKPNWEQDGFYQVSLDGKLATFTVGFPGDLFGVVEGSTLDGTITAITASRTGESKVELTPGDKTRHDAGPFKISAGGDPGLAGNAIDVINIEITGDHQVIKRFIVMDGDIELEDIGYSSSEEDLPLPQGRREENSPSPSATGPT